MSRVCVLLMDSFGIGASLDASTYGDGGADTFGHIFEHCQRRSIDDSDSSIIKLPHLAARGLYHAHLSSTGKVLMPELRQRPPQSLYGYAVEQSKGKDTPSGHWEICGLPVIFDWGYFAKPMNCFPDTLIEDFIAQADIPGVLGEKHASGTTIIEELGEEHLNTLKPIVYTSADSVFQVAAHESAFGLERLYDICDVARRLVDDYNIGRVIARPFTGTVGQFTRTGNRRDLSTPPHEDTLLDKLKAAGREVIAIGKTADIFAHRGVTAEIKANGNMALFDETLKALQDAPDGSLIFSNFVDFDSKYGHRRDIDGYADALEAFDRRLPELDAVLRDDDMVIITADHGCDPSFPGSDHTREHIPLLAYGPTLAKGFVGRRDTFADIGQGIADHLGITSLSYGVSFLAKENVA